MSFCRCFELRVEYSFSTYLQRRVINEQQFRLSWSPVPAGKLNFCRGDQVVAAKFHQGQLLQATLNVVALRG
jgi:hypothetical protein